MPLLQKEEQSMQIIVCEDEQMYQQLICDQIAQWQQRNSYVLHISIAIATKAVTPFTADV